MKNNIENQEENKGEEQGENLGEENEEIKVEAKKVTFDIQEILQVLPHRYPMLLIDKVLDYEEDSRVRALKNVTMNEEFFQGHFPDFPVMPGVLIIEAMAQAGGFLLYKSEQDKQERIQAEKAKRADDKNIAFFAGIKEAKFRRQVRPGDILILEAEILRLRSSLGKVKTTARVDDELAAEAVLTFATRRAGR